MIDSCAIDGHPRLYSEQTGLQLDRKQKQNVLIKVSKQAVFWL